MKVTLHVKILTLLLAIGMSSVTQAQVQIHMTC